MNLHTIRAIFFIIAFAASINPIYPDKSEDELDILLELSPDSIIPDITPVTISIHSKTNFITDPSTVRLTVMLPETDTFLTTEYPVIEGTELIHTGLLRYDGNLSLRTILPIRGKYIIRAEISSVNEKEPEKRIIKTAAVEIGENPDDLKKLLLLGLCLFSLGIIAGYIFRKSQHYGNHA